jgi:hypothetical protein
MDLEMSLSHLLHTNSLNSKTMFIISSEIIFRLYINIIKKALKYLFKNLATAEFHKYNKLQ